MSAGVFARTDVLGFERMEYELTSEGIALGLDGALPAVLEMGDQIGESGRGERSSADTFQLTVRIVGVGVPTSDRASGIA